MVGPTANVRGKRTSVTYSYTIGLRQGCRYKVSQHKGNDSGYPNQATAGRPVSEAAEPAPELPVSSEYILHGVSSPGPQTIGHNPTGTSQEPSPT